MIRDLLVGAINKIHLAVFKRPPGEEMKKFLTNLQYVAISTLLTAVILFIVNVFAGRILGPDQYGRYLLIVSLSNLLVIPMLINFHTSIIKYLAEEGSDKKKLISTSLWAVIAFSIVAGGLLWLLSEPISRLLGVDRQLFNWTLIFTVAWGMYTLIRSHLRALHDYKYLSLLDVVLPTVIFIVFFLLILLTKDSSYLYPTLAMIAGYVVYSLFALIKVRRYSLLKFFDSDSFKALLRYGSYGLIASIAGYVLGNVDKLIINKFVSSADVGIYGAYLSSSSSIPNQVLALFLTVFAPTVAKLKDRSGVYSQMKKLGKVVSPYVFLLSIATTTLIIKLFGSAYPLSILLVLYFSLNISIIVITKVYSWFIAVDSLAGMKFISVQTIIAAVANIGLNLLLIPRFGISGAIWVNILCQIYILISSRYYLTRRFGQTSVTK